VMPRVVDRLYFVFQLTRVFARMHLVMQLTRVVAGICLVLQPTRVIVIKWYLSRVHCHHSAPTKLDAALTFLTLFILTVDPDLRAVNRKLINPEPKPTVYSASPSLPHLIDALDVRSGHLGDAQRQRVLLTLQVQGSGFRV